MSPWKRTRADRYSKRDHNKGSLKPEHRLPYADDGKPHPSIADDPAIEVDEDAEPEQVRIREPEPR